MRCQHFGGGLHFHRETEESLRFRAKEALDYCPLLFRLSSVVFSAYIQLKLSCSNRNFWEVESIWITKLNKPFLSNFFFSHLLLSCTLHLVKWAILVLLRLHVHSCISEEMWTIFKLNDPLFFLDHMHFPDSFLQFRISSTLHMHRQPNRAPSYSHGCPEAPAMSQAPGSRHNLPSPITNPTKKATFFHCTFSIQLLIH